MRHIAYPGYSSVFNKIKHNLIFMIFKSRLKKTGACTSLISGAVYIYDSIVNMMRNVMRRNKAR